VGTRETHGYETYTNTIRDLAWETTFKDEIALFTRRVLEGEGYMTEATATTTTPAVDPKNGTAEPYSVTDERRIRVDFSKPDSPFKRAKTIEKRRKLFVWGDSGCGKTWFALQFPKPAVLDLERGSEEYGNRFDFDVLPVTTADDAMAALDWLATNRHDYRTLVIDPITVYWEALQKKWSDIFLTRNKGGKGFKFEFYELQPRDWNIVKAELRHFIRKILALDMNVIVTARQKTQYADGGFMRAIGETFDGEKSLPYLFDTILQLRRSPEGKFYAKTIKDRTGRLPAAEFENEFSVFERAFGKTELARKAKPVAMATARQIESIRKLSSDLKIPEERMNERLAHYGAESLEDLTEENAAVIFTKLEAAIASRKPTETQERKETDATS
jgi:hypothetical protein